MSIPLTLIVEDQLSEAVAVKALMESGKNYEIAGTCRWSKDKIKNKIASINESATGHPYCVLTDQDTPSPCPPTAIRALQGAMHPNLLYRFAVMEIESWVMADREGIADFLSVSLNRIPREPDGIAHPKEHLIGIARKSRKSNIKRGIVPQDGSTSKIGPTYNAQLCEFVSRHWDVKRARRNSPSLERAFGRFRSFTPRLEG